MSIPDLFEAMSRITERLDALERARAEKPPLGLCKGILEQLKEKELREEYTVSAAKFLKLIDNAATLQEMIKNFPPKPEEKECKHRNKRMTEKWECQDCGEDLSWER